MAGAVMIAERVPLGLDIPRLRAEFERTVRPLPMACQSEDYGGWSVLSRTGDHLDGWQRGHVALQRGIRDLAEIRTARLSPELDYVTPTPLCVGYVAEVLAAIRARGFYLARVRFALLRAMGGSRWHRDGLEGEYSVRLHVAVITNEGCLFRTKTGAVHMPADGDGYLVDVAQMHEIVNQGAEDRVHLFMPVWDLKGASRSFRMPASKVPSGRDMAELRRRAAVAYGLEGRA